MKKIIPVIILSMIIFIAAVPVKAGQLLSTAEEHQQVATDPYSLIDEVNALRAARGLPAYATNSILMSIAQAQAQYMASTGNVTHIGPGGTRGHQRALAAGYPVAGDLSLGGFFSENIIAGNNLSVQEAVSAWQGDDPHLNTMLSPNLQEIGAGMARAGDVIYYVIDCSRPSSAPISYTPNPSAPVVTPNSGRPPTLASTLIPNTPGANGKVIHVVQPGETLWLIAVSYGVKVADLRRLNNLAETQSIYPNQKLLVRDSLNSTPARTISATSGTSTNTPAPSITAVPTWTLLPSPTATPPQVAAVSSNSSQIVLGVIIAAALVLAAVFVRAGRRV